MSRKVVQLVVGNRLWALCDDGTIWYSDDFASDWKQRSGPPDDTETDAAPVVKFSKNTVVGSGGLKFKVFGAPFECKPNPSEPAPLPCRACQKVPTMFVQGSIDRGNEWWFECCHQSPRFHSKEELIADWNRPPVKATNSKRREWWGVVGPDGKMRRVESSRDEAIFWRNDWAVGCEVVQLIDAPSAQEIDEAVARGITHFWACDREGLAAAREGIMAAIARLLS